MIHAAEGSRQMPPGDGKLPLPHILRIHVPVQTGRQPEPAFTGNQPDTALSAVRK